MRPVRFDRLNRLSRFSVPISRDNDGYIGRECPNPECGEYFKITLGTGLKDSIPCHCPYCGHTGGQETFATPEQLAYAESIALGQIAEALHEDLKELEFSYQTPGPLSIGISMKVQPGAPIPIRWYREKELESHIVCDQC